jgi:hypothetical protein
MYLIYMMAKINTPFWGAFIRVFNNSFNENKILLQDLVPFVLGTEHQT